MRVRLAFRPSNLVQVSIVKIDIARGSALFHMQDTGLTIRAGLGSGKDDKREKGKREAEKLLVLQRESVREIRLCFGMDTT